MLRRILLAVSGGECTGATSLAIEWSRAHNALLVGLGVVDPELLISPEPIPVGAGAVKFESDRVRLDRTRRSVEQLLERFTLRCAQEHVPCKLLEDNGHPEDRIIEEAQRFDLVVVSRDLRFRAERKRGDHDALRRLLSNSPRPVVSVPERCSAGKSAVIAYDGRPQAGRALFAFLATAANQFRDIHVVSVGPTKLEAARRGDRAVEFIISHGLRAQLHTFIDYFGTRPPEDILAERAQELDAGVIVMGAYGHGPWREAFFGSTTDGLLRNSDLPVFLYH